MSNDKKTKPIPSHVAIIMDGNGRWAKKQNKERFFGHQAGAESARVITETAAEIGIEYLTLYAFSKENWRRPKQEVYSLMNLLINAVNDNLETLIQKNIKVLIIGDMQTLPDDVRTAVEKTITSTAKNTGLTLIIALNYSSRWEITNAVQKIAEKIQNKQLKPDDISEKIISQHLNTKDIPDPDLLIRTSGEYRISNFLLWQLSYSELYFTNTLWPDFRRQQFLNAIDDYRNRERRFGKTSEQLK